MFCTGVLRKTYSMIPEMPAFLHAVSRASPNFADRLNLLVDDKRAIRPAFFASALIHLEKRTK